MIPRKRTLIGIPRNEEKRRWEKVKKKDHGAEGAWTISRKLELRKKNLSEEEFSFKLKLKNSKKIIPWLV